jgi:hypothetical protein
MSTWPCYSLPQPPDRDSKALNDPVHISSSSDETESFYSNPSLRLQPMSRSPVMEKIMLSTVTCSILPNEPRIELEYLYPSIVVLRLVQPIFMAQDMHWHLVPSVWHQNGNVEKLKKHFQFGATLISNSVLHNWTWTPQSAACTMIWGIAHQLTQ